MNLTQDGAAPDQRLRILVVLDESDLGRRTAEIAVALAARMSCDIVFQVAIAMEPVDAATTAGLAGAMADYHQRCSERAEIHFAMATAISESAGVKTTTVLTVDEEAYAAVQRVASEHACEMIVVGSHGRGALARVFHGSLVDDLVRLSQRPVLVVREDMHLGAANLQADNVPGG